jgi:hypothetical protein
MAYSRWNWLLLLVGFAVAYEAATWTVWVPLNHSVVIAQQGTTFVPYWEGQVFAFAAIRILAAELLSVICFVFPPSARGRQMFSVGALMGIATSVLDRFGFNWVNARAGFLGALFGIPMLSGGILVAHFVYKSRKLRSSGAST